ncbi:hypothetical protein BGZ74_000809 [Mortierella antarctica]|nr:hypothetical protein BGZ74_000809 [Mortierella antarctica]
MLYAPQAALAKLKEGAKQHVDILGSIYSTISYAYSTAQHSNKAHAIVARRLRQFASLSTSILYFDGEPALEKRDTHEAQANIRSKALTAAAKSVDYLLSLVENGLRVRKQHFVAVKDNLRKAWAWSPSAREELVKVPKVWRPWSQGCFLQYHVDNMLKTLCLSQVQWTTLGIVSANDYNKNVYGLGIPSNFGIIKGLKGSDVPSLIQEYLQSDRVAIKNVDSTKFNAAIKVFVHCQQTPVPKDHIPVNDIPVDDVPINNIPMDHEPIDNVPVDDVPVDDIPVDDVPVDIVPKDNIPSWESTWTNILKAIGDTAVAADVLHCLRKAVQVAADAKHVCQKVLGLYLETIFVKGNFEQSDKVFLNHLCQRVAPKASGRSTNVATDQESDQDNSHDDLAKCAKQEQFIAMLLRHLISGEPPHKTALGTICNDFIVWLRSLGVQFDQVRNPMDFPAGVISRSVAKQLDIEFKNHFGNGSHDLCEKLLKKQEKGVISSNADIKIYANIMAIENFVSLNRINKSARTDGFRFSLLAFKIRELQSVRYRHYPAQLLPSPLLSMTSGTNGFLTEIRNVVHSQQDVQDVFGCPLEQIKILGIDLGHACLIGSFLLLPEPEMSEDGQQQPKEYNHLAVKTKAVYQPILKLRNWMNKAKHRLLEDVPSGAKVEIPESKVEQSSSAQIQSASANSPNVSVREVAKSTPNTGLLENGNKDMDNRMSINAIESQMPALCGDHADIPAYFAYQQTHHDPLDSFYNGNKYQFNIGAKRDPNNKVIIAIGMSKFDWNKGLSSLDSSFQSYFINKARSLGYLVVGVNEHYTSQKCPTCQNFVARVGKSYRRLYCETCHKKLHRDTMAAHNMCNIVHEHLLHQRRPLYLQPKREDGTYPWMDGAASLDNTATNSNLTSKGDSTVAVGSSNTNAGSSNTSAGSSQKKPRSSVPSSNEVQEANTTASGSITAGTGTTGSKDESKAHSASRPKHPHASGKQKATKDSTKRKANSDDSTEPKNPRAAKRVAKAAREDPVAMAGTTDKANNSSASTSLARNARLNQVVQHTTACVSSKATKAMDNTLGTSTSMSPGPTANTPRSPADHGKCKAARIGIHSEA